MQQLTLKFFAIPDLRVYNSDQSLHKLTSITESQSISNPESEKVVFVTLASAIFLSYKMSYSDKVSMFSLSLSQFVQASDLSGWLPFR